MGHYNGSSMYAIQFVNMFYEHLHKLGLTTQIKYFY